MDVPIDGGPSDVQGLCSHLGLAWVRSLSGGGEADLALVEEPGGARYALKHYRPGFAVSPDIHDRLRDINHTAVLRIHRTGVFQGRHFELTDYFADRSLADWWNREPLGTDDLRALIRHVGSGLDALHRAGIVHRDLKPANLLVHHDPLAPVIADFGVSRVQDGTQVLTEVEGTARYEPPEAHEGVVSAAGDRWALGMIVYELATGEHPFAEHTDREIVMALAAWSPDVTGLPRPLRRVCEGLLALDQRERWSWARVSAWLDGDERPAETRTIPAAPVRDGIRFAGGLHTTREGFADAVRENWGLAERRFLTDMIGPHGPSEGWSMLREWLRQFRSADEADSERLIDLIDRHLVDPGLEPGIKVLHLLRWLDPEGTPVFNGSPITVGKLVEACVGDLTGERRPRATAQRVLQDAKVQKLLADLPGLERLRRLRAEADELAAVWNEAGTRGFLQPGISLPDRDIADTPSWTLKYLAVLAGDENRALRRLADRSPAPPSEVRHVYDGFMAAATRFDAERRARGEPAVLVSMVKILFGHRRFRERLQAEQRRAQELLQADQRRDRERQRSSAVSGMVDLRREFDSGERHRLSESAVRKARGRVWGWYWQWALAGMFVLFASALPSPSFGFPTLFLLLVYGMPAAVASRRQAHRHGAAYQPPGSLWHYATHYRSYPKSPGRRVPFWPLAGLVALTVLVGGVYWANERQSFEGQLVDVLGTLTWLLLLANLVASILLATGRRAWNEDHLRYIDDFRERERRQLADLPPHLREQYANGDGPFAHPRFRRR